jgi:hypothetical protein
MDTFHVLHREGSLHGRDASVRWRGKEVRYGVTPFVRPQELKTYSDTSDERRERIGETS